MDGMTVLCVESQVESLRTLRGMLEGFGYEVVDATTGRQALDLLARRRVDGVLLEYDLPDATGATVRAQMKQIRPDVPVVLFAGVGSQTPILLRFFDSYLRDEQRMEARFEDRAG
jgi:two-component system, sensor histidine kinase and response regulator